MDLPMVRDRVLCVGLFSIGTHWVVSTNHLSRNNSAHLAPPLASIHRVDIAAHTHWTRRNKKTHTLPQKINMRIIINDNEENW